MDAKEEAEFRKKIGLDRFGDYQGVIFGMGNILFRDYLCGLYPPGFLDSFGCLASTGCDTIFRGGKKDKSILYVISPPGASNIALYCEWYLCHGPADMGIGVGTAGSVVDDIEPGDIVVPQFAVIGEGASLSYGYELGGQVLPHTNLSKDLMDRAGKDGKAFTGKVFTTDSFCAEDGEFLKQVRDIQAICGTDMETSALFSVSRYHGKKAAAILVASDKVRGDNHHYIHVPKIVYKNIQKAVKIATEALLDSI